MSTNKRQLNFSLKNKITKLLKQYSNYFFVMPILIYYAGFFYSQGKFMPMNMVYFSYPWDITYDNMLSMSNQMYFVVGLRFFFILCIYLFIAYIIWIYTSFDFGLKEYFLLEYNKNIDANSNQCTTSENLFNKKNALLYMIIDSLSLYGVLSLYTFMIFILFKFACRFKYLFLFIYIFKFLQVFIYFIVFNIITINLNTLKLKKYYKQRNMYIFMYSFLIFLSITLNIYYDGYSSSWLEDVSFFNGRKPLNLSVLHTSNSTDTYYKIDITDSHFIGYDLNKKSIVSIPNAKINKIESSSTFASNTSNSFCKYISENSQVSKSITSTKKLLTNNSEKDTISNIINNLYLYRFKTFNVKSYIMLFTDDYKKNSNVHYVSYNKPEDSAIYYIPFDITEKRWKLDTDYNTKDYLGIDMSIQKGNPKKPYKNLYGTEYNEFYKVYVIEYWLKENIYIEYTVVKENGHWKIDSSKKPEKSFILK